MSLNLSYITDIISIMDDGEIGAEFVLYGIAGVGEKRRGRGPGGRGISPIVRSVESLTLVVFIIKAGRVPRES